MRNEEFNIGDYVKFESTSKGAKLFTTKCVVLDVDKQMYEMLKKVSLSNSKDDIVYILLSNENEEFRKFGREIEIDIEEERNSTIDNLFNKDE